MLSNASQTVLTPVTASHINGSYYFRVSFHTPIYRMYVGRPDYFVLLSRVQRLTGSPLEGGSSFRSWVKRQWRETSASYWRFGSIWLCCEHPYSLACDNIL